MEGPHLILTMYGCPRETLSSIELLSNLLDTLPDQINMTKIMPPYVFKYSGKVPEDWGLSGFVLIAESHISFHTFVELEEIHCDIFSCKPFDIEKTTSILLSTFYPQSYDCQLLNRR